MELCSQTKPLISRCQTIEESNQSYAAVLHRLEEIAYSNKEDAQTKNNVLYNALISGLRDKDLVDPLIVGNAQADRPGFLDTAKKAVGFEY